ncbi:MAG: UDP-3-O-(3-hydroxymyristoyl)glucosamine N-acyltransferase [Prolixibacteraceae bacterium]|nr:UDP-3-O-(3-hydroxymyristoyl)glucosamine N-acyltransferase [Prolixibacteraceae bacterium]
MEFTARQIAAFLGGEVIGDQEVTINNVSKIEEGEPGTLTFLANPKYEPFLYETKASVVLVNKSLKPLREVQATMIRVHDAYDALARLMELYVQSIPVKKGIEISTYIHASSSVGPDCYVGAFAYIDEGVKIGKNVQIYPHCWIGRGAEIGDNTVLFSGVKIYPECKIGKGCILHAGVVIGADGFGFAPLPDGSYKKLHQVGNVVIEDDVEIGANTTVDCATMGSTIIRKGVKLDNLVQVAHNCEVGKNTVIAAQTGIAGSSSIGENCIVGGQVGVAGHLKIGNKVTIAAKSGISNNVNDGSVQMGEHAFEAAKYRRSYAVFRNLPTLFHEVNQLRKEINKQTDNKK